MLMDVVATETAKRDTYFIDKGKEEDFAIIFYLSYSNIWERIIKISTTGLR